MMSTETTTKYKDSKIGLIPENWDVFDIQTVSTVIGGGTPSTANENNFNGSIPWITPRDLSNHLNRFISHGERNISEDGLNSSNAKLLPANSVLLTTRAPVGYLAIASNEVTTNQGFHSLVPNDKTNSLFLFYLLKNNVQTLVDNASGSTFQELNGKTLKSLEFAFPKIKEQEKIAEILSSIDDKIELNRAININLEKIAIYLFKEWFVDVGDNIKSQWKKRKLGEFFPIKTGKKDANVATEFGRYPFFSCSQNILRTEEYSFDSSSILLAGNGDFNVKWYEGKFEAYQRTYVLTPHKKELLGFLYYLIKYFLDDITAGHRGSVISFITKGMIENFEIMIPDDEELSKKAKTFYEINQMIDGNNKENEYLSRSRDSLLPRLMTGRIRVK